MTHSRIPPLSRRRAGFTLLELLVTITIVGILSSIALPSFRSLILNQRIKTASFDLVASLTTARSEAIKWNGNVTMTPALGSDWTTGWNLTSPGGTTGDIKVQSAYTNVTIDQRDALGTITGPVSVVYDRSGRVSAAVPRFQVSDAAAHSTIPPRCITVGLTGQPTTKVGSCH